MFLRLTIMNVFLADQRLGQERMKLVHVDKDLCRKERRVGEQKMTDKTGNAAEGFPL